MVEKDLKTTGIDRGFVAKNFHLETVNTLMESHNIKIAACLVFMFHPFAIT